MSRICHVGGKKKKVFIFFKNLNLWTTSGFLPGLRPQLASISWRMVWTLFRDPPENSMCQKIYSTSHPVLQTQGVLVEPFLSDINPKSNYSEIFFTLAEAVVAWSTWGFKGLAFWSRLQTHFTRLGWGYSFTLLVSSHTCHFCKRFGDEQVKNTV